MAQLAIIFSSRNGFLLIKKLDAKIYFLKIISLTNSINCRPNKFLDRVNLYTSRHRRSHHPLPIFRYSAKQRMILVATLFRTKDCRSRVGGVMANNNSFAMWPAVLCLLANSLSAADYELTDDDILARQRIEDSISSPGFAAQTFSSSLDFISSKIPKVAKNGLANLGSYLVNLTLNTTSLRNELRHLAFGKNSQEIAQYDAILNQQKSQPNVPVSPQILNALLDKAGEASEHWHKGYMSGGIYDGSPPHMRSLADSLGKALLSDAHNRHFFVDKNALNLAVKALAEFQTSNPLHGNKFPLAQMSMRKLGAKLGRLVDSDYALVSSGSEEALHIAIRALKKLHCLTGNSCILRAINDDEGNIHNVAATLNIGTTNSLLVKANFAVLNLTKDNIDNLDNFLRYFANYGLDLHIHFDNYAFKQLFLANKDSLIKNIFNQYYFIRSASFDTDGMLYQGVSATLFADAQDRLRAFDTHVDWAGGMYPGINTAGSLPGIDYIIAYLMLLYYGDEGLAILATKVQPPLAPSALNPEKYLRAKDAVLEHFENKQPDFDLIDNLRHKFFYSEWHSLMEILLQDLSLHIFGGSADNFAAKITSGGTESIRIAMLTYFYRFKTLYPNKTAKFLMTETAHIAFDRQIKDFDGIIVRVKEKNNVMDIEDLRQKISDEGGENIAAIVASSPNYPLGTADDIRAIARIALDNNIPLHVDACLGAFINQFIKDNSVTISLSDLELLGITSLSGDFHKYGVTPKGLSLFILRRRGDLIMPTSICKTRSSAQLEVGLACLLKIGRTEYEERAQNIVTLAEQLREQIANVDGIEIIEDSTSNIPRFVVAFRLKEPLTHLTYTLDSFMSKLGWHLSSVGRYTLHIAITNAHTYNNQFLAKFISDLGFVVRVLQDHPHLKQTSSVGLYGMAACPKELSYVPEDLKHEILSGMLGLYAEHLVDSE